MSLPVSAPALSSARPVSPGGSGNPLLKSGRSDTKAAEKFSFLDLLDVINPLQHIPIVNNIYREVTGDTINNAARIAGGTLYGGFIGAAVAVANVVSVNESGQDIGGNALTKLGLLKPETPTETVASKDIPLIEITPADKIAAKQAPIIWDKVEMASVQTPKTETPPEAMPSPESLNALEPGSPAVEDADKKEDIQKNMLDALSKYNAMQKISDRNPATKPVFADLVSSPATSAASRPATVSPEFKKLRRYSN